MSRIRFQPEDVRTAGVAFVTAGDDLSAGAAALRGMALPAMPPAMVARYTAEISSAAARLQALCGEQARIGEELQVRAEAAVLADSGDGTARSGDGRRLARALDTTVDVVGASGVALRAHVKIGGGRVTATSSSGLRISASASELGLKTAAAAAEPHRATVVGQGAEQPGSPRGQETAAAPAAGAGGGSGAGAPQGGLAGATALDAVSAHGDGGHHAGGHHDADLRAADHDGSGGQPAQHPMPTHADADRQDWACWMAGSAAHADIPPALPLMVALAHSGMHNLPADGSSAGFFGIDAAHAVAPPGHGLARGAHPDASWWADQPDAQLDHVLRQLREVSGGSRDGNLTDSASLERWAQDAGFSTDAQQLADVHDAANAMVSHCSETGGSAHGSGGGGGALGVARGQLGVHEVGANTGPEVNRFLAAADTAPGNPWCASFVTWSLEQSGHELPGDGWAAVQHWVGAASAGEHGLSLVDAAHARPGDIVAYDWGGDSDFGQDGHIGFLESKVEGGQFTAVEGNANDAVSRMQRSVDQGNVVFIRANG